jgi:uncharacterized protein (DUF488 family)
MTPRILTIGHSNHSIETFTALLHQHLVTAIADVRSDPYSRFNPAFNRDSLDDSMKGRGIVYVFLGHELGARSKDPSVYIDGRVQYQKLAQTDLFKSGLQRIVRGSHSYRLALLCAEKEPLNCHRTILVAKELERLGTPVTHILADGSLETHEKTMTRLLRMLGMMDTDLYRTREELIVDACARQEQRIAYVDEERRKEASA